MRNFLNGLKASWMAAAVAGGMCVSGPALGDMYLGSISTYQGRLELNGQAVNGTYDIVVRFFDQYTGGNALQVPMLFTNVPVVDGLFTINIPAEGHVFDGGQRTMEFEIRQPGQPTGQVLSPRQWVRHAPYADYSFKTRGLDVNSTNTFAAIGRSNAISSSERFGVHADTSTYGGMYVSTKEDGEPFYGYALGNAIAAWHYFDSWTDQWRLMINNGVRLSVTENGSLVIGDSGTQNALRITPSANSIRFWKDTAGSALSLIDIGERYNFKAYNVGINDDEPATRLSVVDTSTVVASFNRKGSDGALMIFLNDDVLAGSISLAGGVASYNAFTGSHYAHSDEQLERGMLLSMTGDNHRNSAAGETIHGVVASTKANDPAIIGAFNGLLETAEAHSSDNPILAMSDGNGDIWVVDDGRGNLKPGDLLIASDVRGCAMLDNPQRFAQGNIVARVAGSVNWAEVSAGSDGLKRALVPVLFDRSIRGAANNALQAKLESQQAELSQLRALVAELAKRMER